MPQVKGIRQAMGKIIITASGKGGTGKTTTTANLGAALALRGHLTAVVDMDMGLRNLDIVLGLESDIVYDISDVIDGGCSLDDAVIKDRKFENLYFIPAPQTRGISFLSDEAVKNVWEQIRARFEYCIVDVPAGIEGGFLYAAPAADAALIVTMPELTALRDADRTVSVLEDMGVTDIKVIINRIRPDMIERGIMINVDECVDRLQVPVAGLIPDDEELAISALKGEIAVTNTYSRAGTAFKNIAARIDGEEVPVMDFDEKKGFLRRLFQRRRQ